MRRTLRHAFTTISAAAIILVGISLSATPALADYGRGAVYQVEISANDPSGGFWMWAELSSDHTGDYQETDCVHTGSLGLNAAAHASGSLGWSVTGNVLTLTGVKIIGGAEIVTITIPVSSGVLGHYNSVTIIPTGGFPIVGVLTLSGQVQVAP